MMQQKIISIAIFLAGVINFIPIIGMLSAAQLSKLYGIDFTENNLHILMAHRALMFGIAGGFMMYAAFQKSLQKIAILIGFISMIGFMLIAWIIGGYNALLAKIILADVVGTVFLIIAVSLLLLNRNRKSE